MQAPTLPNADTISLASTYLPSKSATSLPGLFCYHFLAGIHISIHISVACSRSSGSSTNPAAKAGRAQMQALCAPHIRTLDDAFETGSICSHLTSVSAQAAPAGGPRASAWQVELGSAQDLSAHPSVAHTPHAASSESNIAELRQYLHTALHGGCLANDPGRANSLSTSIITSLPQTAPNRKGFTFNLGTASLEIDFFMLECTNS